MSAWLAFFVGVSLGAIARGALLTARANEPGFRRKRAHRDPDVIVLHDRRRRYTDPLTRNGSHDRPN